MCIYSCYSWSCVLDQGLTFRSNLPVLESSHSDDVSAIDGQLLGYSLDSINEFAIVSCCVVVGLLIRSCLLFSHVHPTTRW